MASFIYMNCFGLFCFKSLFILEIQRDGLNEQGKCLTTCEIMSIPMEIRLFIVSEYQGIGSNYDIIEQK